MRRVIGVAGTAKNTGKTTTLQAVAAYLRAKRMPILLTSIGYDGEDVDMVTGLPKPKISVEEGDWIATALPLMETSAVVFKDARYTGVDCALGPVYLGMAASPGRVVLAGPAGASDIERILEASPEGCTVLLDGAFSRLSPMSAATDVLFATGAARHPDPARLGAEIEAISSVMAVPEEGAAERCRLDFPEGLYSDGSDLRLTQAVSIASGCSGVLVEGPVNPHLARSALRRLAEMGRHIQLVVRHPVDMLLSGDFTAWPEVLKESQRSGHRLFARRSSRLLGFTLSPYLPMADSITGRYSASLLPARWFLESVRSLTKAPCTDIVLEGPGMLEEWLGQVICCNRNREGRE